MILWTENTKKYTSILAILVILAISAYFRLYNIREHQMFLGDQGRDVLIVKRMLVDKDFTFIGPTASVGGFFLGPIYYYMMAFPLAVSNLDPVGPAVMVAVLSIVTTWLCYEFGKRYFSLTTGIVAATIFAVSRLVVEYARSSWNPNVLPFFSMVLVYSCARILESEKKYKWIWLSLAGVCLGTIIQLHYQAIGMHIFAAIVGLIYFWKEYLNTKRITFINFLSHISIVIVGMIVVLAPFLAFEAYHQFPNTQNIYRFVFENRGGGFSGGYTYEYLVRDTVYRLFLRLVAAGNDTVAQSVIIVSSLGLLAAVYLFFSRFYLYIKQRNSNSFINDLNLYCVNVMSTRRGIGFSILILWALCGILFWGLYKKAIYDYYYSYMYALPIIIFAASLGLLISFTSRRFKKARTYTTLKSSLTVMLMGLTITIVGLNIKAVREIAPARQVYRTEEVAKAIVKHKVPGPYNFALITPGNSDHAYRYFLEIWGEKPTLIEDEITPQLMVFCEQPKTAPKPCEPEGNPLWEVAGFGQSSIVGEWEVIGLPLYRLEHIPEAKELEGKPARKG